MKKFFLYTCLVLFTTGSAYSQIRIGVRTGANISNIKISQDDNQQKQLDYSNGLGFHFGLTSQLQIKKLYLQPELLFSTVTHEVTVDDIISNGTSAVGKQRFNKIDIPIIAGLKFDNNFKFGLGPVFTTVVSSKSDVLNADKSEGATVGYQLLAGWDWDNFSLEFRYEGNLQKYGSGVKIGGNTYDFDARTNQFILSLAYYF